MAKPRDFENFPTTLLVDYGPYMGSLQAWHDPDTPFVLLSLGVDNYAALWLRLDGVKAPELYQRGGKETLAYVQSICPPGTPFRVTTIKTPRTHQEAKSFVRYVATVQTVDGNLNEKITAWLDKTDYPRGK